MQANDERCRALLRKHGAEPTPETIAAVREAFFAGLDQHVMRLKRDETTPEALLKK